MHRKEHETHADNQRELELHELRHELGKLLHELREIRDELRPCHPHHSRTTTAAIGFGDTIMSAPGTLTVGSTLTAVFQGLLADGVTVNTATTLSTVPSWSSSDTSVATVSANADGTALVTGVGAGTATITGTAGSFTDSDGLVVGPLDASNTVSDTAAASRTVSAQVSFQ